MPNRTRTVWASRWVSSFGGQRGIRRRALLLPLVASPLACASGDAEPSEELGVASSELTGGQRDLGDPNVVLLLSWNSSNPVGTLGSCTAEVVAPDVLLTAAHCLASNRQHYAAYLGDDGRDLGTPIDPGRAAVRAQLHMAKEVHPHPRYIATQGYFDIGVVILQEDLKDIAPLPIHRTTPTASVLSNVSIVGYGKTYDRDPSFAVTKYRADGLSATLDATHTMTVGDAVRHACVGDSGGPVLADIDGVLTILGVDSYSDETGDATRCRIPSRYQRVDPYLSFIDQYVPRGDTGGADGPDGAVTGPDGSTGYADAGHPPGWTTDAGESGPSGPGPVRTVGDAGLMGQGTGGPDGGAPVGGEDAPSELPEWNPSQDTDSDGCAISQPPLQTSVPGILALALLAASFPWRRRRSRARHPNLHSLALSLRMRSQHVRGVEESER